MSGLITPPLWSTQSFNFTSQPPHSPARREKGAVSDWIAVSAADGLICLHGDRSNNLSRILSAGEPQSTRPSPPMDARKPERITYACLLAKN
ncbi:hypothetical protein EVAR_15926_1 [Eumeta japonica]|uniref:Uncharacterized protein n=1 Tax=Eumeta variegata TaxID=151549 RepID=A0A4C1UKZ9_EUMVA|nr:hypothetical protein EVAR_15926_1 [Eumeta japonica]